LFEIWFVTNLAHFLVKLGQHGQADGLVPDRGSALAQDVGAMKMTRTPKVAMKRDIE
jgi:hypothetical protein